MTFTQGLLRARSHIAMILGLIAAFGLVTALELWDVEAGVGSPLAIEYHPDVPAPGPAPLTEEQTEWARTAWKYFENNTQDTGLVNSADNYPATTMWDTGSYLLGLISAQRLEIISQHTFDNRLSQALTSLARLPLFDGALPNKSYNTKTLALSDYDNSPNPHGIGWSAIDLARLLAALHVVVWDYPRHTPTVQKIIQRWDWGKLSKDGQMQGASVNAAGVTTYVQEGRLGYEQYAAKALQLRGLDMSIAADYTVFLKRLPQYGFQVPTDLREADKFGAHNYVVSEPYILDGLEFGGDRISKEFAFRLYRVQEERYKDTGILTAVSEDHLDQAPYFVYNTVFVDGGFWKAITDQGEDMARFKSLSSKAAFGWDALYRTPYSGKLVARVKDLHDPQRGWYSGLYEENGQPNKAITANTNAIILQALAYRQFGPLLRGRP